MQDFRYVCRQLRHTPGFSVVVIATLAVGIGGTTAMFGVMQAVLLAPLPYAQPGELVRLYQQQPDNPATRGGVSAPHFRSLREQPRRSSMSPRVTSGTISDSTSPPVAIHSGCASCW